MSYFRSGIGFRVQILSNHNGLLQPIGSMRRLFQKSPRNMNIYGVTCDLFSFKKTCDLFHYFCSSWEYLVHRTYLCEYA